MRVVARDHTMTVMETSDGFWQAIRTDNGRELWRVKAPTNVVGRVAISPHAVIVPSSSFDSMVSETALRLTTTSPPPASGTVSSNCCGDSSDAAQR